jgi:ubiquinone/menaquinone biosynthesis C-methylase UbiE
MTDDPQSNITRFWSKVAPSYESHGGNVAPLGTPEYDAWVAAIKRLLPPAPADVLDIACGTGFLSLIAAGLGHRVTGIDLSDQMLAEARRTAAEQHVDVQFETNDAVAPSFPPETFDAITNRHFLWTLREPETAFRNWRALLRPGGRVVSIDGFWFSPEPVEDAGQMEEPNLFDEHYTAETKAALPVMRLQQPEPVAEMFRHGGYVDVRISHLAEVHAAAEDPPGEDPWYVITAIRS